MRDEPNAGWAPDATLMEPQKVLVDLDSRTVAMEVGTCQGVCNNSPAESISPENGWRWSVGPIPGRRGGTGTPVR